MDLLVIDLYETATDEMSLGRIIVCYGYDLLEGSGNDALGLLTLVASHHGVGFSASCLSVGKDSSVVAFEDIVDQREGCLLVY